MEAVGLGKLSVPGRPTRIIVGQGHIVLAVGTGGACLDTCYSLLSFLSSFSLTEKITSQTD